VIDLLGVGHCCDLTIIEHSEAHVRHIFGKEKTQIYFYSEKK